MIIYNFYHSTKNFFVIVDFNATYFSATSLESKKKFNPTVEGMMERKKFPCSVSFFILSFFFGLLCDFGFVPLKFKGPAGQRGAVHAGRLLGRAAVGL